MLSVFFGFLAAGLGLAALGFWKAEFIMVVKGLFPISLFFAGLAAIFMGASNRTKENRSAKKDRVKS